MPTAHRPWTSLEVRRLLELRAAAVARAEIARMLGRTQNALNYFLRRYALPRAPRCSWALLVPRVRKLVLAGDHDALIALKLKRSKTTVKHCRRAAGLPANKAPGWGSGYDRRTPRGRPRCFGCDELCPVRTWTNWCELTGWTSRRENGVYLVLCKTCSPKNKDMSK